MNNATGDNIPRANTFETVIRRGPGLKKGQTVLGGMEPLSANRPKRLTGGVQIKRESARREQSMPPASQPRRRNRSTNNNRPRPVSNRTKKDSGQPRSWLADQGIKTVACAAIALCVWGFSNVDTPVTNAVSDGLSVAVNADMKLDSDFGRLKFVENLFPQAAQLVFWQTPANAPDSLTVPCDGEITVPYDDRLGNVTYSCLSDVVTAAADGVITAVDRDADGFLRVTVEHTGGLVTRYGHLNTVLVRKDDRVAAGSRLALMASEADVPILGFAVLAEGRNVDPGGYMAVP